MEAKQQIRTEGMEALQQPPPAKRSRFNFVGDEIKICNFIGKLKDINFQFYMFQRFNYLKGPAPFRYGTEHVFRDKFVEYENVPNPVQGIDLGDVKHLSHDTMVEITNDFSEENCLRKSVCGQQFRGKIGTRDVVVKKWDFFFPIHHAHSAYPYYFSRQLEFLLNPHVASHPKMAKLIGFCCEKTLALVWHLNLNLTLHDLIPHDSFTWNLRMKVARQVVDTLGFFHKKQIALCNFFAPCISVDEDYNIQLFEFDRGANLANEDFPVAQGILRGAHKYYSPESIRVIDFQREWFFTTDVYHFGLLLMELTLAKCVEQTTDVWVKWATNAFEKGDRYSPFNITLYRPQTMMFELAMKCVQEDPMLRPKMDEIIADLNKIVPV